MNIIRNLIIVVIILFSIPSWAANYFVRAAASGSNNGSNWTNAWHDFDHIGWGSIVAGDTIWVAGGTYVTQLAPTVSGTNDSTRVSIRRARTDSTECTSATGWSSGYASLVTQSSVGILFPSSPGTYNYITISGATTSSGGTIGWNIDFSALTEGNAIQAHSRVMTYNRIEYIELIGPGEINHTGDCRGIDWVTSGSSGHNVFSHVTVHGFESGTYHCNSDDDIYEYMEFYNIATLSSLHSNTGYLQGTNRLTLRYSKLHNGLGEGWAYQDSDGISGGYIYGNLFYDEADHKCIETQASAGTVSGIKIFNNTFDNITSGYLYQLDATGSNNETRNNIYSRSTNVTENSGLGTVSNNLVTSNAGVFVDRANHNFRIVSTTGAGYPRNAGYNVGSPYNQDPDGVTRGTDGTWDIGAYEYVNPAPTITNIASSTVNGQWGTGTVVPITVTVSEASTSTGNVTVTTNTTPTPRTCTFTLTGETSGSCNYTVQATDTSADLDVTVSGTIIADATSLEMTNFTPAISLATNKALVVDTTVPTMSSSLPSGQLNCDSEGGNKTISLTTNENATCKFNAADGHDDAYADMTTTFMGAGTMSHSSVLALACNASYTYHVRCTDTSNPSNVDTTSEHISFSIGTTTTKGTITLTPGKGTGSIAPGKGTGSISPYYDDDILFILYDLKYEDLLFSPFYGISNLINIKERIW